MISSPATESEWQARWQMLYEEERQTFNILIEKVKPVIEDIEKQFHRVVFDQYAWQMGFERDDDEIIELKKDLLDKIFEIGFGEVFVETKNTIRWYFKDETVFRDYR